MADERDRRLERSAATGGPEDEERLAHERCRSGEHEWSPWNTLQIWAQPLDLVRRSPERTDPFPRMNMVQRRICFWCFAPDHRRFVYDEETPAEVADCSTQSCRHVAGHNGPCVFRDRCGKFIREPRGQHFTSGPCMLAPRHDGDCSLTRDQAPIRELHAWEDPRWSPVVDECGRRDPDGRICRLAPGHRRRCEGAPF